MLNGRYPAMIPELEKSDRICQTVEDVGDYFRARIAENPKTQFIGVFDHFAHTRKIGGDWGGKSIREFARRRASSSASRSPHPQILALRPRSTGVADMGDRFVVSFMEAPVQRANVAMESRSPGLREPPAPLAGR